MTLPIVMFLTNQTGLTCLSNIGGAAASLSEKQDRVEFSSLKNIVLDHFVIL